MSHVKSLKCRECGNEYPIEPQNVCDFCFGPLEVTYDYDAIARVISKKRIEKGPMTMWRYHDLLPVDSEDAVDLGTSYDLLPFVQDDDQIRLNDVVLGQLQIRRRVIDFAETRLLDLLVKLRVNPARDLLVVRRRGGIHVVSSVDDLVALAVAGDTAIVAVGELDVGVEAV